MAQVNLRALPSLKDYSNNELKLLANVAPAREYPVGQVICREGAGAASCFLLATGEVNISKKTEEGDKILATLRAGAIVGQMALVDRAPRSATVTTSAETIALELTRDVFEDLLRSSSALALRFQEQIAIAGIRQLRVATQRLATILADIHAAAEKTRAKKEPDAPIAGAQRDQLLTVQAALDEWDMSLEDLDNVHVYTPDGQMGQAELKARMGIR